MIRLTRQYRFSASHRLHSAELSEEENRATYGKCNNPFGHGHNYVLQVVVAGAIDDETGMVVDPRRLDRLVLADVLERVDHRNLNDLDDFAALVPTTENLAAVVEGRLRNAWRAEFGETGPTLDRVRILETKRNSFESNGVRA